MSTAIYGIAGLTCGYCLAKVLESVRSLSGVTDVAMDLVRGGKSPLMVISRTKLGAGEVREAVERAGFDLTALRGPSSAPRRGRPPRPRRGYPSTDRAQVMCSIGGVSS